MIEPIQYDITVIGGGLAGLAISIQLANKGFSVALFEKEQYPFHKVCGEYISMESWAFIESLGLPLTDMNLPRINKLLVSAPNGNTLQHVLPLGGFGISRFTIDNELKNIAIKAGVKLYENTRVEEVVFDGNIFYLQVKNTKVTSKVCTGSFGKRSNLDIKWKRQFLKSSNRKLNNYIGVKYHIETDVAPDTIALHNFKDGYCGISKIEKNCYCLCYLTSAANLKDNNNSIEEMEKNVLYKNKYLKNIFESSTKLYKTPLAISQISFDKKSQVHDHVLLCGDAAGLITPLCGNGMSMALHSSKIAAALINDFLLYKIDRVQMENNYQKEWQQLFAKRLSAGRFIQQLFGKVWATNVFIGTMKMLPNLTDKLIRQTHGEPF